jgi:hypothetical protein
VESKKHETMDTLTNAQQARELQAKYPEKRILLEVQKLINEGHCHHFRFHDYDGRCVGLEVSTAPDLKKRGFRVYVPTSSAKERYFQDWCIQWGEGDLPNYVFYSEPFIEL